MEKRLLDEEEEEEEQSKRCKSVDLYETGYILKDLWLEMLDTMESESDRLFNLLWSFRSCPSWVGRGAPREIIHLIAREAATLVDSPVRQAIEKQHFTLTYICQVHNSVFDCCAQEEDDDDEDDDEQDEDRGVNQDQDDEEEDDDDDKMYFVLRPDPVVKVELDCEIEDNPYTEMRVDFMVWNPSLDVIREAVEVAQALVNLPDVDEYPGIRFGCSLGIDGEELLDEMLLDSFEYAEPVLQAQDLGTVLPNKPGDTMVLTEFYYRNE